MVVAELVKSVAYIVFGPGNNEPQTLEKVREYYVGGRVGRPDNAHHAGLACGACGGRNGGLNAQIVADMLNEPVVRAGLEKEGIVIPQETWVAGGTSPCV